MGSYDTMNIIQNSDPLERWNCDIMMSSDYHKTHILPNHSRHLLSRDGHGDSASHKQESLSGSCREAMDNKELCLWCRRGLLAYVYSGVFVWMNALVAGTALI